MKIIILYTILSTNIAFATPDQLKLLKEEVKVGVGLDESELHQVKASEEIKEAEIEAEKTQSNNQEEEKEEIPSHRIRNGILATVATGTAVGIGFWIAKMLGSQKAASSSPKQQKPTIASISPKKDPKHKYIVPEWNGLQPVVGPSFHLIPFEELKKLQNPELSSMERVDIELDYFRASFTNQQIPKENILELTGAYIILTPDQWQRAAENYNTGPNYQCGFEAIAIENGAPRPVSFQDRFKVMKKVYGDLSFEQMKVENRRDKEEYIQQVMASTTDPRTKDMMSFNITSEGSVYANNTRQSILDFVVLYEFPEDFVFHGIQYPKGSRIYTLFPNHVNISADNLTQNESPHPTILFLHEGYYKNDPFNNLQLHYRPLIAKEL